MSTHHFDLRVRYDEHPWSVQMPCGMPLPSSHTITPGLFTPCQPLSCELSTPCGFWSSHGVSLAQENHHGHPSLLKSLFCCRTHLLQSCLLWWVKLIKLAHIIIPNDCHLSGQHQAIYKPQIPRSLKVSWIHAELQTIITAFGPTSGCSNCNKFISLPSEGNIYCEEKNS